jgi:hypothetical protein
MATPGKSGEGVEEQHSGFALLERGDAQ